MTGLETNATNGQERHGTWSSPKRNNLSPAHRSNTGNSTWLAHQTTSAESNGERSYMIYEYSYGERGLLQAVKEYNGSATETRERQLSREKMEVTFRRLSLLFCLGFTFIYPCSTYSWPVRHNFFTLYMHARTMGALSETPLIRHERFALAGPATSQMQAFSAT